VIDQYYRTIDRFRRLGIDTSGNWVVWTVHGQEEVFHIYVTMISSGKKCNQNEREGG
jgi:hypothetical protein